MKSRKPQLFLIHFSGGNIYSYQFLIPFLTDFEVFAVELPGRGKRANEPIITNFKTAVQDIYRQIVQRLNGNEFHVFGHSMGSILAIRVSKMLEDNFLYPSGIVVSGNPGPGKYPSKKRYLMPDAEFKKELINIGGMPDEVLDDEELFNYFKPLLMADFQIIESEDITPFILPVQSPLYAVMGNMEEYVNEIRNWQNFTKSKFSFKILAGNHFFIYDNAAELADIIRFNRSQN